jgi:hypothetical protein
MARTLATMAFRNSVVIVCNFERMSITGRGQIGFFSFYFDFQQNGFGDDPESRGEWRVSATT